MKYNDYELLDLIYDNDEVAYDIMLNKYKPIIYNKALEHYIFLKNNNYTGFTFDDIFLEGIVAFNNAIKNFDPNKESLFYSYLLVCLTSKFNLMFRDMFRLKHRPLLNYQELDYEVRDSNSVDPYDNIDILDVNKILNDYLYEVSFIDAAIIELRLNNFKYCEIEELLDVNTSQISRVIKNLKKKFKHCY